MTPHSGYHHESAGRELGDGAALVVISTTVSAVAVTPPQQMMRQKVPTQNIISQFEGSVSWVISTKTSFYSCLPHTSFSCFAQVFVWDFIRVCRNCRFSFRNKEERLLERKGMVCLKGSIQEGWDSDVILAHSHRAQSEGNCHTFWSWLGIKEACKNSLLV